MTLLSERTPEPPAKTPGTFKALFHRLLMAHGRKLVIALPYLWLTLLFMLPFLIVFKISLAELALAVPPYTELLSWADGKLNIALNFANYLQLTDDPLYIDAYLQSLRVAAVSTLCCLIIGYPLAWAVAHSKASTRNILLLLVILPSWTSFLIRVYAWMGILKNNGILNNFLMWLGVIDQPLVILHTNLAVYIGIVYSYLPFMVLPIYTALIRLDYSLVEASLDLGARPLKTFFSVIVPLTRGGIIAGSMLVFIPAVGEFVIPELLGGPDSIMIGRVLWQEFFNNRDWPVASAVATIMLLLLIVPILWFHKHQNKEMGGRNEQLAGSTLTVAHRHPDGRLYLPVCADADAGDLLLQQLQAGDGVGRLVHALVYRTVSRLGDDQRGRAQPDHRRRLRHRRGGTGRHRRRGDGALRPLSRFDRFCVYVDRTAGDAGRDHRPVAAAAVRGDGARLRLAVGTRHVHHLAGACHLLYRLRGGGDQLAPARGGSLN